MAGNIHFADVADDHCSIFFSPLQTIRCIPNCKYKHTTGTPHSLSHRNKSLTLCYDFCLRTNWERFSVRSQLNETFLK